MAYELWGNDAGVARQIREVWVNDAGVARRITEIWVNDAGVARQIFGGDAITIADMVCAATAATPTAQYQLRSDGNIYGTNGTNAVIDRGDWIRPQINMALYSARMTTTVGSFSSGTVGSWLNLGTQRTWTRGGAGTNNCQGLLEIRRDSDGVVLGTATITLESNDFS